ncbi:hypothetical protein KI387_039698, partial [Taxus chinensis]
ALEESIIGSFLLSIKEPEFTGEAAKKGEWKEDEQDEALQSDLQGSLDPKHTNQNDGHEQKVGPIPTLGYISSSKMPAPVMFISEHEDDLQDPE